MSKRADPERIYYYSDKVAGDERNHGFAQKFDYHDGYIGIQQFDGERVTDRVLLSPAQWRALVAFMRETKAVRA